MAKPIRLAGLARAAVALLYCFGALFVLGNMSTTYHWDAFQLRAPIFALVPWAYTLKWKNGLVAVLSYASLFGIMGAFLMIALPARQFGFHPYVPNVLGFVGFAALIGALAVHAWLAFWGWRADRKRLRESSRGPLEHLSGGF